ncbi:MAG: hypothetical protein HY521_03165 [Proteobacteria bacterium]|nr:hypothetical protein [Pseudomonadota bacterium]
MSTKETSDSGPQIAHLSALACLLGTLVGVLQAKDVLFPEEVEEIFRASDAMIPVDADAAAGQTLSAISAIAGRVAEAATRA